MLRNPDLRGSYFLQEFFSIEDKEAFEKLVEQRKQEKMPQKLSDYTTLHGKANVKSQTSTWQFWYNIPKFAKDYEDQNKRIADTSKKLVTQFKALRETMQELSDHFNKLGELYIDTDDNMHEINKTISALLSSWSDSYEGQGNILKNWFPRFFNYNMNEYKSMIEMLDHRHPVSVISYIFLIEYSVYGDFAHASYNIQMDIIMNDLFHFMVCFQNGC